jgi:hypothetical protein
VYSHGQVLTSRLIQLMLLHTHYFPLLVIDSMTGFDSFKPLPDDHRVAVSDLLASRRKNFKEGEEMAATLMRDITADRRILYHDRAEYREQRLYGFIFFILTCMLDGVVSAI